MAKFERIEDKWKHLREDLYGNTEPRVEMRAITLPVTYPAKHVVGNRVDTLTDKVQVNLTQDLWAGPAYIDAKTIEQLPAISAGVSYGATEKLEMDHERAIKLNKKLLEDGHDTPFESVQMNFRIFGLSKTAGAQLSRYRSGNGHVSASRRFRVAGASFVYPMLDYIDNEEDARYLLERMSSVNNDAFTQYSNLKNGYLGFKGGGYSEKGAIQGTAYQYPALHKEDARQIMPVSYATAREWWVNVRALRYIFKQRLKADTESELRRLCWMIYDMVCPLMPSLFEDITEEKITISLDEYRLLKEK